MIVNQSYFYQNYALDGSAIFVSENLDNLAIITNSVFESNYGNLSLIKTFFSGLQASNLTFNNNPMTIFSKEGASVNIKDVAVYNTDCSLNLYKGCVIDAVFQTVKISNLTAVNITLHSEGATLYCKNAEKFEVNGANLINMTGSKGSCIIGKSVNFDITGLNAKDFYGGCISASKLDSFSLADSNFDNTFISNLKPNSAFTTTQASSFICSGCNIVTIKNSTFTNNINQTLSGGGVYLSGSGNNQTAVIDSCSFSGNLVPQTGGAIYASGYNLTIKNSDFSSNSARDGGAIYYTLNSNQFTNLAITNANFLNNIGNMTGGAVSITKIIGGFIFDTVYFSGNQGFKYRGSQIDYISKGGALYFSCTECNTTLLKNTRLENNQANVGGAIFYDQKPIFWQNTTFSDNKATSVSGYGPHVASYPVQLVYKNTNTSQITLNIFDSKNNPIGYEAYASKFLVDIEKTPDLLSYPDYNTEEKYTFTINFEHQSSGHPLSDAFVIVGIDHYGQAVGYDDNTTLTGEPYYVRISQKSGSCSSCPELTYSTYSYRGAYNFNNSFAYSPSSHISLTLDTNIFKVHPSALYNNSQHEASITFRDCVEGEIAPLNTAQCIECPYGNYSLNKTITPSTQCYPCTDLGGSSICWGGKNITILPGHWRLNTDSANVLNCTFANACYPAPPNLALAPSKCGFNMKNNVSSAYCGNTTFPMNTTGDADCDSYIHQINNYCSVMKYGSPTGVCNKGYKNVPFCGVCDKGYGITSKGQCVECNINVGYILTLLYNFLFRIGLIGLTVYSAHTKAPTAEDREKSCALRIVINYFQIMGMFLIIPMEWPGFINDLKSLVGSLFNSSNKSQSGGFSYECLFDYFGWEKSSMDYYQLSMMLTLFSPILYIVFFALILLLHYAIRRYPIFSRDFLEVNAITATVIFFYIWPGLMQSAFTIFDCVQVNDPNYQPYQAVVRSDPSMVCYEGSHILFSIISAIPILLIWGILVPFFSYRSLRKQKNTLGLRDPKVNGLYGFMYQGYKEKTYWWEFVGLARKLVFLFVATFISNDMLQVKCLTLFLVVVFFLFCNQKAKPFVNDRLNFLERISNYSLCAIIYASLYQLNFKNTTSTLVFAFIAFLFTATFFGYWMTHYLTYLRKTAITAAKSINKHSKFCAKVLLKIFCLNDVMTLSEIS